ncbi:unnamed protein product, partial [Schistosoma intercalatum]
MISIKNLIISTTPKLIFALLTHFFLSSSYCSNPSDCKKAKYMTFDFTNLCGLGCSMHQLMYCLQLALENERVLVLKKHYPGDIFREWLHQNMLPLSEKCSYLDSDGRSDNINCPWIVKAPQVHNWLPHVLPIDMNKELLRLHEAPFVWFAGQLAAYILRPKTQFAQLINVTLKGFKTSGDPVAGVHIRRTDKLIWEAQFHNLSQYMEHVDNFFDLHSDHLLTMSKRHDMNVERFGSVSERIIGRNNSVQAKRSVYLSTDDPNIFTQLPYSYPNYTVYGSQGRSQSANLNIRMSVNSMNNAIIDIIALSMTDFLVCTFSSNVCRLAYELMQTRHMDLGDATQLFHSIDKFYHEEDYQRMKFDVIIPDMKVNLKYGDVVEIRQINWNGSVYPNYTVYGSRGRSQSAYLNIRMSVNSMNNAIIDIIALSMTDFLVCTFSSNILRNHVMVRVGGGWDTLSHFLSKYDECRKVNPLGSCKLNSMNQNPKLNEDKTENMVECKLNVVKKRTSSVTKEKQSHRDNDHQDDDNDTSDGKVQLNHKTDSEFMKSMKNVNENQILAKKSLEETKCLTKSQ